MTTDINTWGLIISIIGTFVTILSFVFTLIIAKNARLIRRNLTKKHKQAKYKKSKKTIILQMTTSYQLLKDDGFLDGKELDESIIALTSYKDLLGRKTKRKLKSLKKLIDGYQHPAPTDVKKKVRKLLYELIHRLENEFDENIEYSKEITK
ncbi:hypothetical protein [Halobacillus salinus]|uniref:Uncharacterized protein n=1 Tax=Halobacillus salinus TaxID=192814 RepID=A0A4Z0H654_9BACI|nr:hypothetical protein [Halobacillus salinus]TGB05189.1 hypothetical protein E4663_09425 [Halobacillus salinus]